MRVLRFLGFALGCVALAILIVRAGVISVALPYAFWRLFRESGYPWWIQVPAAVALVVLFWMLHKRHRRGRFDGPF